MSFFKISSSLKCSEQTTVEPVTKKSSLPCRRLMRLHQRFLPLVSFGNSKKWYFVRTPCTSYALLLQPKTAQYFPLPFLEERELSFALALLLIALTYSKQISPHEILLSYFSESPAASLSLLRGHKSNMALVTVTRTIIGFHKRLFMFHLVT